MMIEVATGVEGGVEEVRRVEWDEKTKALTQPDIMSWLSSWIRERFMMSRDGVKNREVSEFVFLSISSIAWYGIKDRVY